MEREEAARRFRAIGDGSYRDVPLYRRLALAVAERPVLLDVAAALPDHALAGGLVFSVFHYLALAEGGGFGALWRREERAPASVPDLEAAFEAFVLERAERIAELVARHRGAQTNEVNRCAYLLPGLATVAARRRAPLAVLEIGASAGLLLNLDRYSYRYGDVHAGPPSPVSIQAELRGPMPPVDVPEVGWRLGVDRAPIDVHDEDEARWLLAAVYPGDSVRAARTAAAIAVAREHPPPLTVGEASNLDDLAALAPRDLALAVVTTAVLMYLDPGARTEFRHALARIGRNRPVDWLACEPVAVLESLGPDVARLVAPFGDRSDFVGPLIHVASDRAEPELLAATGPHGRWIDWRGTSGARMTL